MSSCKAFAEAGWLRVINNDSCFHVNQYIINLEKASEKLLALKNFESSRLGLHKQAARSASNFHSTEGRPFIFEQLCHPKAYP